MARKCSSLDTRPQLAGCCYPVALPAQRGFTLVELIVVMIAIAVLAVSALPRFLNPSDFDTRGFYDETTAALRYAQKSAVAQRRTVCVTFAAAAVTLTISAVFGGPCNTPLTGPNGDSPYALVAPAGVAFVVQPTDFSFLPSGAASLGQTYVTEVPGRTVTVDATTGYVQQN